MSALVKWYLMNWLLVNHVNIIISGNVVFLVLSFSINKVIKMIINSKINKVHYLKRNFDM